MLPTKVVHKRFLKVSRKYVLYKNFVLPLFENHLKVCRIAKLFIAGLVEWFLKVCDKPKLCKTIV